MDRIFLPDKETGEYRLAPASPPSMFIDLPIKYFKGTINEARLEVDPRRIEMLMEPIIAEEWEQFEASPAKTIP